MKKRIKILICIIVILNIKLFSQIIILKTYSDTAFVKNHIVFWDFNDSLPNGNYVLYNNAPNLKSTLPIIYGQFKDKKRAGIFLYYSNYEGKTFIKSIKNYRDGKLHGFTQDWYFGNTISLTGEYFENKKNGEWKTYYKNGNVESITNYKMDTLSNWIFYYKSGQVKSTGSYSIFSSDTIRLFNTSNKLIYEGIYSSGKFNSWKKFNENGIIIKESMGEFNSIEGKLMEIMTSDYQCFSCLYLTPEPYNGFVIEYLNSKPMKSVYKNGNVSILSTHL